MEKIKIRSLRLCFITLIGAFLCNTSHAIDITYSKTAPSPVSYVQGNSILRTNNNDGLITAGTTENPSNPVQKEIHVIKTNDGGVQIFSKRYNIFSQQNLYCARINYNVNQNGYVIVGTTSLNDSTFQPFIIEIDELGNVINTKVWGQVGLAFLDVTPTPQGNYVFTGFRGKSVGNLQDSRVGVVVKTDGAFNQIWTHEFASNYSYLPNFAHRWNIGEKIIAFMHEGQEKYFVTGGTQRPSDINFPAQGINVVALSILIDQNGNLLWNNSCMDFEFGADAEYDSLTKNIYVLCNRADPAGDLISHIYRLDVLSGVYNYGYWFEGNTGTVPIGFHDIYSYKLKIKGDIAVVFGILRNYIKNPGTNIQDSLYNSFRLEFNISDPSIQSFTLIKKRTKYYEQSNSYNFLLGTYCSACNYISSGANQRPPQIVTQDMGVEYVKNGNNLYSVVSPNNVGITTTSYPQVSIANNIMGSICNIENPSVSFIAATPLSPCNLFYSLPVPNSPILSASSNPFNRSLLRFNCSNGNYSKTTESEEQLLFDKDEQPIIYPQPAEDKVQIELGSRNLDNLNVLIYSISGIQIKDTKYIKVGSKLILNTEQLTSGIYFMELSNHTFKYRSKLFIVK